MAIQALNSAATGLRALSTKIDVIANNLANVETTAFKASRVNFEDLMYVALRQPGVQNSAGAIAPAGVFVGLGVKISNTQISTEQGPLENTGRPLDIGISGNGFFKVRLPSTVANGEGYTRNGNLFVNRDGDLVVGMGDGYLLDPPINIPPGTPGDRISIAEDGNVSYIAAGATSSTIAGRIALYQFNNPQGLDLLGGSIYTETDSSGPGLESNPTEDGAGRTLSGFLESSNADPVKELVTLIKTQRAFELNSQSIESADQALQTVSNLRRG